ncbi:MAG: helix-turn-helix domain-containing protein [Paracoccus sp. (in: a-proteobacteria)]
MRGYAYRLKPTEGQEHQFRQFAGVCRLVWNLALEQRRIWGKSHGCNFHTASIDLKNLRAEFDFIGEVSQTAQQQALMDLDKAYQAFFAGRAGYPKPRRKGEADQFRFMGREVSVRRLNRRWSEIRAPLGRRQARGHGKRCARRDPAHPKVSYVDWVVLPANGSCRR